MQTFVPFADFAESASVLDNKRLNKQLLEGRQIYNILRLQKTSGPWVNHPAVKMWRSHHTALYTYLQAIREECDHRGIATQKNWNAIEEIRKWDYGYGVNLVMPPWWGDDRVHESHKFNLYKKDPIYYHYFYNAQNTTCCDRCNYFWPVENHAKDYSPNPNWSYV